ncbi:MAG: hypothetical protein RIT25_1866, partial [Planctomycetota bacterium]
MMKRLLSAIAVCVLCVFGVRSAGAQVGWPEFPLGWQQ